MQSKSFIVDHTCSMMSTRNGSDQCVHNIDSKDDGVGFCDQPTRFRCSENLKRTLPRLSYSGLGNYSKCSQLYYLRDILGVRYRPHHVSQALKAGILWDAWLSGADATKMRQLIDKHQMSATLVAKVKALTKAAKALGLKLDGKAQLRVSYPIAGYNVIGYVDRAHEFGIAEDKLSSRPDFYTKRENIEDQVGTYFMAEPKWEYVDICVVRLPALKTGKGKQSDETANQFTERIYLDIIKRPSYYFLKLNRKTGTYGVRFHRAEFDLEGLERIYTYMIAELRQTIKNNSWYPRRASCYVPLVCDYHPICSTGVISELLYEYREHKVEDVRKEVKVCV